MSVELIPLVLLVIGIFLVGVGMVRYIRRGADIVNQAVWLTGYVATSPVRYLGGRLRRRFREIHGSYIASNIFATERNRVGDELDDMRVELDRRVLEGELTPRQARELTEDLEERYGILSRTHDRSRRAYESQVGGLAQGLGRFYGDHPIYGEGGSKYYIGAKQLLSLVGLGNPIAPIERIERGIRGLWRRLRGL